MSDEAASQDDLVDLLSKFTADWTELKGAGNTRSISDSVIRESLAKLRDALDGVDSELRSAESFHAETFVSHQPSAEDQVATVDDSNVDGESGGHKADEVVPDTAAGQSEETIDEETVISTPPAFEQTVTHQTGGSGGEPSTRAARSKKASAEIPTSIGNYDINGVLGRGGMGVVYRARQRGLNRDVALKMILGGGHANDDLLTRFRAEAEAVAQL